LLSLPKKKIMGAVKTTNLSVRITPDTKNFLSAFAKKNNTTSSAVISQLIAKESLGTYAKGGITQGVIVPNEIQRNLELAGTTMIGILAYNQMHNLLSKQVDDKNKAQFSNMEVNLMSGATALLLAFFGSKVIRGMFED
jgi:hypothetical protein